MIPSRKLPSRKAKSVFFRKNNDIDIFVEDTERGTEKLYTILFSKAFEDRYTISKVYPLGGKHEVIKCWKKSVSKERKELYIIDSDFSLSSFEKDKEPYRHFGKGLLYTPRFCIENYLINQDASASFLDTMDDSLTIEEIKTNLRLDEWYESIQKPLHNLFIHFYCARAISEDTPTLAWNFKNILKNGEGEIDSNKVDQICIKVKEESLKVCSEKEWDTKYALIESEISTIYQDSIEYYVCGKHFLLGLLTLKLKSVVKFNETNVLFKQMLARHIPNTLLAQEIGCIV